MQRGTRKAQDTQDGIAEEDEHQQHHEGDAAFAQDYECAPRRIDRSEQGHEERDIPDRIHDEQQDNDGRDE